MPCTTPLVVQVCAIVVGLFGVIASFLIMFDHPGSFINWVRGLYALAFALVLIELEFYVFGFHKYFGFLLKNWGKACMYLFVGGLLFWKSGYGLWCGIIYWVMAVVFGIVSFLVPVAARPLCQGGVWGSPDELALAVKSGDIFKSSTTSTTAAASA
jgi:hypothetical protein